MRITNGTRSRVVRSGFTLLELLVAMALFALISLAGFALLGGIIGTRDRLDGRLEQVAELQRAMYVMTLDLESMTDDPIEVSSDSVAFRRAAAGSAVGSMPVRYQFAERALQRDVGGLKPQTLVRNVSAVSWRFMAQPGIWSDSPAGIAPAVGSPAADRPRAVELTLVLAKDRGGLSGPLRRVVELPRQP